MDFQVWEARNLARCTLSEVFHRVIYHMNERQSSTDEDDDFIGKSEPVATRRVLTKERITRIQNIDRPRFHHDGVPHYRRFARSFSLSSSSGSVSSQEEHLLKPVYRRFSRSVPSDDSPIVMWPAAGRMNAFLGKAKIEEFIKKNWRFGPKINFNIDFKCIIRLRGVDRYKYSSLWSNGYCSSRIYFTIDASSEDDYLPVTMTYSLPDGKRVHRPDSSKSHVQTFLKNLDPSLARQNSFLNK